MSNLTSRSHRRPSRSGLTATRPSARSLAGARAFAVSWCVARFASVFQLWLYGDVRFYENWGNWTATHQMPYRDFSLEYPPGALLSFLFAVVRAEGFGYIWTYYDLVPHRAPADRAAHVVGRRVGAPPARRVTVARVRGARSSSGIAPLLLGPIAIARYDYLPALLTVLARRAAAVGRERTACAVLAAGFVVKLYPAFLLPIVLVALGGGGGPRRARRSSPRASSSRLRASCRSCCSPGTACGTACGGSSCGRRRSRASSPRCGSARTTSAGLHIHSVKSFGSDNFTDAGGAARRHAVERPRRRSRRRDLDPVRPRPRRSRRHRARMRGVRRRRTSPSPRCSRRSTSSGSSRSSRSCAAGAASGRPSLLGLATGITQLWEPYNYGDFYRHFDAARLGVDDVARLPPRRHARRADVAAAATAARGAARSRSRDRSLSSRRRRPRSGRRPRPARSARACASACGGSRAPHARRSPSRAVRSCLRR